MNNRDAAQVFYNIADLLEIKGEQIYKVLAYRRAAESILSLGRDLRGVWKEGGLETIPGVGKAIGAKIDELLRTGKLGFYEELKAEVPATLAEVLRVGDVGPKKAARFWKELGITTLDQLERAARDGRLRGLSGMGEKSEARILASIEALRRRQSGRIPIGTARPIAESLLQRLRQAPDVAKAEMAGSLRRWRETVGDLDLIVGATDPDAVMQAVRQFPEIARIKGQGETKFSAELVDGLRVQLWVHPPERFGTALQYATGSQAHNVRLRERALDLGLSLSEHGFKRSDGKEILCAEEAEVYQRLGLPWIPPELREDQGEVQAASAGRLPELVTLEALHGELHSHTDWSDGQNTIEEMARGARSAGLSYLVISDHSQSLGVVNGLTVERLRMQWEAIAEAQHRLGDSILVLRGAEVEIRADGELDYPDEILAALDVVTASVHTSLRQSRERVTARMLSAVRNPHVDVIGHPTGRMVGGRDPAELDLEAVLAAARESGVALEINAHPARLDLKDAHARRAVETGCRLAINSDAHSPADLELRPYGVATARRGWVGAESVVNAWPRERLLAWLGQRG
ncbi:MAG TPA: DNA polymerase/3'-5' exonuclease PolX [Anaerolineales bacterium]|nr:DNA polymerase/3'-5' exonuclease PolX [Anaerolineales bacterium]